MSRAFVKEDGAAPEPVIERPISSAPNRVTPRGLRLIAEEIARLEAAIAAEPDEEAAAPLKRDLRYWSARSASAQVVDPEEAPEAAGFGTRVTIRRGGDTSMIEIVGEDEAEPAEGRIAWTSPLARALEDAEPGETVELEAGGGREPIEVIDVAPTVNGA
jgi:transcription elongation GreA/GreB family factor